MPKPPRDETAVTLLRRVGRSLHRLERERVCCDGVTPQQFATLRLLAAAGTLSTSEVASRLGIHLSTASRNLDVLLREGCIRRRPSGDDARAVDNEVTPKGRTCLDARCGDERTALVAVFRHIPPGNRAAVQQALLLLAAALEADAACCAAACAAPAPLARPPRASLRAARARSKPRRPAGRQP